jgi:hypothetical protein
MTEKFIRQHFPGFDTIVFENSPDESIARTNIERGRIKINVPRFNRLNFYQQFFVLCHEEAHNLLQTTDELEVDRAAFHKYEKYNFPNDETIKALHTGLHNTSMVHRARMYAQVQRVKENNYREHHIKKDYQPHYEDVEEIKQDLKKILQTMPRINRKQAKKAYAAQGVKGKTFRKKFNKDTRQVNGGRSKFGRVWRGGLKAAVSAIPLAGGALSDVVGGMTEKGIDPNTLPAFAIPGAASPAIADAQAAMGANTGTYSNTQAVGAPPEIAASGGPALQVGGTMADAAYTQQQEAQVRQQQGDVAADPMPPKKDEKDEKDKYKPWVIGGGILLAVILIIVAVKAAKK